MADITLLAVVFAASSGCTCPRTTMIHIPATKWSTRNLPTCDRRWSTPTCTAAGNVLTRMHRHQMGCFRLVRRQHGTATIAEEMPTNAGLLQMQRMRCLRTWSTAVQVRPEFVIAISQALRLITLYLYRSSCTRSSTSNSQQVHDKFFQSSMSACQREKGCFIKAAFYKQW